MKCGNNLIYREGGAGTEDYNKDNHTLYILNTSYDYGSDEEISIETALDENFNQYDMIYRNGNTSIAAILQLVLSMDYSIILMNRYRQEKQLTDVKEDAMKKAFINMYINANMMI
ncbi:hypothetical protein OCV99_08455 [Dorea acetigenes]|uniref:Uncharacterized protein n=1 Tax=Dorea acetigenes TaxID=2981787 RepID=A0ABT2RME7_9FIRM|nr:hypothetical protein [Dorea acetigenes]MCU6686579.1 hypothetical protein [Dorea acetigenes]SCJ01711.1 Uncharacterised protein [uncultured Clostridium sp.]